jgi:hypothetical protein
MGRAAIVMKTKQPRPAQAQNAFRFLGSADTSTPTVCAIQFRDPHLNGLPILGPGDAGVTYITEHMPMQQNGFYGSQPWWANEGLFYWNGAPGGSSDSYCGFCGFTDVPENPVHVWELSGMARGRDNTHTIAGNVLTMIKGVKRLQAMTVSGVTGGLKQGKFWYNLPAVDDNSIIVGPEAGSENDSIDFGNDIPPNPVVQYGDSPWAFPPATHEFGSTYLGRTKIIAKAMSQADVLLESADMSRLVTADAVANIWYGKTNWRSVDDLTCDFGTGRTFIWKDTSLKAEIVPVSTITGWN